MKRKKKTTIVTFESRERLTIRRGSREVMGWCQHCDAKVSMVTPAQAAAVCRTDVHAIFRGVESGEIHSVEAAEGALMICTNSLR